MRFGTKLVYEYPVTEWVQHYPGVALVKLPAKLLRLGLVY